MVVVLVGAIPARPGPALPLQGERCQSPSSPARSRPSTPPSAWTWSSSSTARPPTGPPPGGARGHRPHRHGRPRRRGALRRRARASTPRSRCPSSPSKTSAAPTEPSCTRPPRRHPWETRLVPGCPVALRPGATVRLGAVTLVLVPTFVRERFRRFRFLPRGAAARPPHARGARPHRAHRRRWSCSSSARLASAREVLADAIHRASPRRHRPILAPQLRRALRALLESELFGHENGEPSPVPAPRPRLLELAAGGTVLLDEIGDPRLDGRRPSSCA